MLDFKPPKLNTTTIQLAKALTPLINRLYLKGVTLDVDAESIARLRMTEGHPTVLAPNHAAHADPAVMFFLSKRLSQQYYYLTARETFGKGRFGGLQSLLLQRLGAYSIVRGTADRNAFRTTRELLSASNASLVIFAEGEISRQNDTVMRFERGHRTTLFLGVRRYSEGGSQQTALCCSYWDQVSVSTRHVGRH